MHLANQYILNLLAQGIGKAAAFVANFLSFILIAHMGGTYLFGQYSYVTTYLAVFMLVADFGMTSVLGKDIAQVGESAHLYWGNFLLLRAMTNAITIVIAIGVAYYLRRELFMVLVIGSLALPVLSARFFEPLFQVYRRPWFSTYSSLAYGFVYVALFLMVLEFHMSLPALVLAFVAANSVYAIVAFSLVHTSLRPIFRVDRSIMKQILRLAVPLGVSGLFAVVAGRVPIFMLAAMESDYAVAIYNAAYRFFDLSALIIVALVSPFVPIFASKALKDRASLRTIAAMVVELGGIVMLPIAIVAPFFSPLILKATFGQNFLAAASVLNILAWASIAVFISLFATTIVLALGVVHFAYWNTATAALLSIVLNYFWIPRYGAVGSAWAILLCEVFLNTTTIYFVSKYVGNIFWWRQWLKIGVANLALAGMLYNGLFEVGSMVTATGSLAIYALLIALLNAVPKETIRYVREGWGTLKGRYAV